MTFFRSSPPDSSKDETPKSPLSISSSSSPPQKPQPAGPGPQFKNRIQSWMKDAEEDAEKAEQYLDKKREKRSANKDIVDKTDVMKTMEAIEKESSSKRKKTPPGAASETERKKQLIRALGRKPSEERVSVYVRKSSVDHSAAAAASPKNSPTEPENKTKQFMDTMAARNRKVSSSAGYGPI